MRAKVTTEVDANLKLMIEAISDPKKPTYRQMLEEKMLEYLKEKDPVGALQAEIDRTERDLNEKRQQLASMRIMHPEQKRVTEYEVPAAELEAKRVAWLETMEDDIKKAIKKKYVNWPLIAKSGGFLSAGEAERWVKQTLEKWKEKHENGHT